MSLKNKLIDEIIRIEGGYVNHPNDRGGPTMYGITEKVARENGYTGPMHLLPRAKAFDIYDKKYWKSLNLDAIEAISPLIAAELADTGVNCGVGTAAIFFQQALNVLNRNQKDYKDIVVDASVGPATINAFRAYLTKRTANEGVKVLLRALNALQGAYYITIAERRPTQEDFVYGWFNNRIS